MKKLLLASTAVVMSAGVAAADVALSGDARMGLVYNGNDVQLTSRARVTFTLSGETDAGLAFGASFRADNAGAAAGNERMTGGTVFISGDFGKLTMGDVASAARAGAGDLYGVGLTGLGDLNDVNYLDRLNGAVWRTRNVPGAGANYDTGALYEYAFEGLTFYVGLSQSNVVRGPVADPRNAAAVAAGLPNPGLPDIVPANRTIRDGMVSVGAKYTWDGLTVGAGYEYSRSTSTGQATVTGSHAVVSAEYAIDTFKAKAVVGRVGSDIGNLLANRTHGGLSVEGAFDATTVTAFGYRNTAGNTHYGIGASYDLGGGASIKGGVVREDMGATNQTRADFGLAFSF